MMKTAVNDILSDAKTALREALGDQLIGVRLFGSYARGGEREDSDIDLLVLVRRIDDYSDLIRRTSVPLADICLRHDVVLSRTFAADADFRERHTPFFLNVRRESVPV